MVADGDWPGGCGDRSVANCYATYSAALDIREVERVNDVCGLSSACFAGGVERHKYRIFGWIGAFQRGTFTATLLSFADFIGERDAETGSLFEGVLFREFVDRILYWDVCSRGGDGGAVCFLGIAV